MKHYNNYLSKNLQTFFKMHVTMHDCIHQPLWSTALKVEMWDHHTYTQWYTVICENTLYKTEHKILTNTKLSEKFLSKRIFSCSTPLIFGSASWKNKQKPGINTKMLYKHYIKFIGHKFIVHEQMHNKRIKDFVGSNFCSENRSKNVKP